LTSRRAHGHRRTSWTVGAAARSCRLPANTRRDPPVALPKGDSGHARGAECLPRLGAETLEALERIASTSWRVRERGARHVSTFRDDSVRVADRDFGCDDLLDPKRRYVVREDDDSRSRPLRATPQTLARQRHATGEACVAYPPANGPATHQGGEPNAGRSPTGAQSGRPGVGCSQPAVADA
jgi:hypothetical protein